MAQLNAAHTPRVVARRIDDDAVEPLLESRAGPLIELRLEGRQSEQQSDARRDGTVMDPHAGQGRTGQLESADKPAVHLDARQPEIVVGELIQDPLRGPVRPW